MFHSSYSDSTVWLRAPSRHGKKGSDWSDTLMTSLPSAAVRFPHSLRLWGQAAYPSSNTIMSQLFWEVKFNYSSAQSAHTPAHTQTGTEAHAYTHTHTHRARERTVVTALSSHNSLGETLLCMWLHLTTHTHRHTHTERGLAAVWFADLQFVVLSGLRFSCQKSNC